MEELELRAYAAKTADALWQRPVASQVFSNFGGSGCSYVCMTSKGINFWHEGTMTSISHDPETRAHYEYILNR
jgi:hypothetical protein